MMACCHESHELHNVMNYDLHHIGTSIHYGEGKAVGSAPQPALPAPQEARVGTSSHANYSHHALYAMCALALLATLVGYCRHRRKGDNVYAQLEAKAVDEL